MTRRILAARVVWPAMARDINNWVKDYQACSRAKVTWRLGAAIQPIPVPQQCFFHIHVDLVGPLPVSKDGFRYLFTIIDRSSRWLESVPLASMEADKCAKDLITIWVPHFEVPTRLTLDQGT